MKSGKQQNAIGASSVNSDDAKSFSITPLMEQYTNIKSNFEDCLLFYRMGDFYELFFKDAEIASKTLGIVLTKRGKHLGNDIPMCGVPIDRSDDYLQRLIAAGHRVAICEQTEDPAVARKRGANSVVRREVVRLMTPGTLTEDKLLEPGRTNFFVSLVRHGANENNCLIGAAAVDISTGTFEVYETRPAVLPELISRLEPREIVISDAIYSDEGLLRALHEFGIPLTRLERVGTEEKFAERRLMEYFGVATLDGFGRMTRPELGAAAAAICYIERTQFSSRPRLSNPIRMELNSSLQIDASTRANLELNRTTSGQRTGSLISTLDRTITPSGARALADWLGFPLRDVSKIIARQDAVEFFICAPLLRQDIRDRLKGVADMRRALGRLALNRGGPRDLASLRDALFAACDCGVCLLTNKPPKLVFEASSLLIGVDLSLAKELRAALAEELPADRRDGQFIRSGYDARLDEVRNLRDESRRFVASLQERYINAVAIRQIKIKYNNSLGFFIEVPPESAKKLLQSPFNATFIHRQTMAGVMRFSTSELAELDGRIANAVEEARDIENSIFDCFSSQAQKMAGEIESVATALATIDVIAGLAELAVEADWIRPKVDESLDLNIVGGRHPVVEAALRTRGQAFVANDCDLSGTLSKTELGHGGKIAVVTGPNMAGKSTFLRQNALIVILAQVGSFVPAKEAKIGVVDRLFSRVGASDDLARGRSTFMVEMVETAAILNQATQKSLVILDEIGRGTATYDGLSIAWAVMEHLHETNRARALFATHFHELTHLGQRLPRLVNLRMRVADWNGDVIFLHEVAHGAADRSYGVQVARLAGLPQSVIERAKQILGELENASWLAPVEQLVADLPLFAHPKTINSQAPKIDPVRALLDGLDPDALTPRQALDAIYDLKNATRA
jgi:DNA mismatch repair protein MutS